MFIRRLFKKATENPKGKIFLTKKEFLRRSSKFSEGILSRSSADIVQDLFNSSNFRRSFGTSFSLSSCYIFPDPSSYRIYSCSTCHHREEEVQCLLSSRRHCRRCWHSFQSRHLSRPALPHYLAWRKRLGYQAVRSLECMGQCFSIKPPTNIHTTSYLLPMKQHQQDLLYRSRQPMSEGLKTSENLILLHIAPLMNNSFRYYSIIREITQSYVILGLYK